MEVLTLKPVDNFLTFPVAPKKVFWQMPPGCPLIGTFNNNTISSIQGSLDGLTGYSGSSPLSSCLLISWTLQKLDKHQDNITIISLDSLEQFCHCVCQLIQCTIRCWANSANLWWENLKVWFNNNSDWDILVLILIDLIHLIQLAYRSDRLLL